MFIESHCKIIKPTESVTSRNLPARQVKQSDTIFMFSVFINKLDLHLIKGSYNLAC